MEFSTKSLPIAVKELFELNNYSVTESVLIHGAEVDLVATPKNNIFSSEVYIEVTTEYVGNTKYGKDVTKFLLIREKNPSATCIIVSSKGFSGPVIERAKQSRIETYKYSDLFAKFEKFDDYIDYILNSNSLGTELSKLFHIYEEPYFDDQYGKAFATEYLSEWRNLKEPENNWLIIEGEYGTGKTALTKILQYRWALDYYSSPSNPIPFRIELRNFTKQFDYRGLLHHFLDSNNLGHLPLDWVLSLIRQGRIILLLDGYDEMAQYLHARERRVCLEALAELSSEGAKGILTSRPNYFSEAEELQVFDILYSTSKSRAYVKRIDDEIVGRERKVDQLLKHAIFEKHARVLKDLTPEQTKELVQRSLKDDPKGLEIIINILSRVFRMEKSNSSKTLSGKPVIISYLLEIVDELKSSDTHKSLGKITEWDIFQIIIDKLMIRDFRRSPEIPNTVRRKFLQKLSWVLSLRKNPTITEPDFKDVISKEFSSEIKRKLSSERRDYLERLFADLRSSATLTRADETQTGWKFSHNSLREFLLTNEILDRLNQDISIPDNVPITDPMRHFVSSKNNEDLDENIRILNTRWGRSSHQQSRGIYLSLFWGAVKARFSGLSLDNLSLIKKITGSSLDFSHGSYQRLSISNKESQVDLKNSHFNDCSLFDVELAFSDLRGADFRRSLLENVTFEGSSLQEVKFVESILVNISLKDTEIEGADFRGIEVDELSIFPNFEDDHLELPLKSKDALGYLKFMGATTDQVPLISLFKHHPKYPIVWKISSKLTKQAIHQRRGLTQRGAARTDPPFARSFVEFLEKHKFIKPNRRDTIEVTETGRDLLSSITVASELPREVAEFLYSYINEPKFQLTP